MTYSQAQLFGLFSGKSPEQGPLKNDTLVARVEGRKLHILTVLCLPQPDEDLFNPDYIEIDRILEVAHTKVAETGEEVTHHLGKWCSLPSEESTWELEDVDPAKVKELESLQILPEV